MADIFISYAREDLERVRPIVRLIEGAGWSVFWDRTIPPGKTWRQYIGNALDDAKCVVTVWSKYSTESEFVQEEAADGKERKILIPVLLEDVRPPLGFRSIQHEDLRYWKGDFDHPRAKSLIKAIKGYAGNPQKAATESSAKSKLVAGRKAERPRAEPPVQARPELGQRESQMNEFTPRGAIPDIEKPVPKSPAIRIGILIALLGVIVVGLAMMFPQELTKSITNSIGMEVSEDKDIYRVEIANRVQKNWAFSEQLAGSNKNIRASLVFKVMPNGEIRDIFFTDRSGNVYLDESAYKAIVKSNPVDPHPATLRAAYVEVGLRFGPEGLR